MLQISSMQQTAEIFFLNPSKKQYLMDISRSISLAHTSVKKNLDQLLKLGLILASVEKRGKRKFPFYKANTDNILFRQHKMLYNLSSLLDSGITKYIEEKLMPKSIVLFGSYRRGEDIETSDIDIFAECREEELNLSQFEKKLDRKIQLHFREKFELYPKELKNNILNGIVLGGFLEGYK